MPWKASYSSSARARAVEEGLLVQDLNQQATIPILLWRKLQSLSLQVGNHKVSGAYL